MSRGCALIFCAIPLISALAFTVPNSGVNMRLIIALSILMLSACGQAPAPAVVDPALAPYLSSFEKDVGASASGINVSFADTETQKNGLGETVGECLLYTDGNSGTVLERDIHIDSGYWATASEDARTEIMYHELGHCALNLQHIFTVKDDHCPTSIMYPYVFGDQPCFANEKAYYFRELESHK
jgi:hypothetical protein